ncbi:cysteine desulfurase [bacterium]|nr:cysteine desulfurase [bacterium]
MRRIFLDNNATTRLDPRVLDAMMPFFTEHYGNPSSVHQFGTPCRRAVDAARETLAAAIGAASPHEIVFTSGGTESNNLAIQGAARAAKVRGRHIVTTAIEHRCVLRSCDVLEREGFEVTRVGVGRSGVIDPQAVAEAMREDTVLVSVMHANNEIGTMQPIPEVGRIARERGALFHTDAVQTAGKTPIDVAALNVDLLAASAHKLHGPKGVGLLYVRKGVELVPHMVGGPQERDRRAGTLNTPAIVGFGRAMELALASMDAEATRLRALRDGLAGQIVTRVEHVIVTTDPATCTDNTLHVCVPFLDSEAILTALDLAGIAASSGSACTSGSLEISHVLTAMGVPKALARGGIRLSLGHDTTGEDIDAVVETLADTVAKLRRLSPEWERVEAGELAIPA